MPTPVFDMCGGFWGRYYPAAVPAAYADAVAAALVGITTPGTASPGRLPVPVTLTPAARLVTSADGRVVYSYPLPADGGPAWVALALGAAAPVWTAGVDYALTATRILFFTDPAADPVVAAKTDPDGSAVVFFGYPLSPAPAFYHQPGSRLTLAQALVVAFDAPAAAVTGEVVESTGPTAGDRYVVVTDRTAYLLPAGAEPVVAVGDVLTAGDALGDTWALTRLAGPNFPARVTVSPELTYAATTAGLTWYNQEVATIVDTVGTRTRIRWALGGTLADVNAYWTASHALGLAAGRTLAQMLDRRPNPDPAVDPTPADLPAYVNPLKLLAQDVYAGAAYTVVYDDAKAGPAALPAAARRAYVNKAAAPLAALFWYPQEVPALPLTPPT